MRTLLLVWVVLVSDAFSSHPAWGAHGWPHRASLCQASAGPTPTAVFGLPVRDHLVSQTQDPETRTRQQGVATRRPGEADTTFLRRVLPVSFPASTDLVAYAWRPSAFGKQLFFSVPGTGDNAYGRELIILDPFQPNTYALYSLTLESLGDATELAALLFANVEQNGQKELLALLSCSLREPAFRDKQGRQHYGRVTQYQTLVFQYVGMNSAGRPQYQPDPTPHPELDNLSSAAAVRQALTRPSQRRPSATHVPK
ncbi:hypothetical protein [Hymenobacter sp. YC55]|uniref:hypothetical protein n=1 Tax=Hymenobacter sp. YC55 TaxID=3034019 RepID=UPI0023F8AD8A|nr:hypothetical protein [Hymenobacter sp. YC55]MDF7815135.1 hypothetical protein [Hymenobacter sp. YC55]